MKLPFRGAIDCDLHPAMPGAPALLAYLDEYWRDQIVDSHIDKYSFVLTSYPPNSPLSARPDWRFPTGAPGGDLDMIRRQVEHSRQNLDTVGVFAGIVVATALVLAINALLVTVDRRVNAWRPTDRHMQI